MGSFWWLSLEVQTPISQEEPELQVLSPGTHRKKTPICVLFHPPPEETGCLWCHCLSNAVRSWYRYAYTKEGCRVLFHCEITLQIPLTIFVSRKYVHEGRAQRTRAILAETGAGAETEVRLWSQQKCGWVFGEYSVALGQCLLGSVSTRRAVRLPLRTAHLSTCHEENNALESLCLSFTRSKPSQ